MLSGEVEADETFVGGKARNMHKATRAQRITSTGGKDKTFVLGILERGGKVVAKVVDNTKKKTLQRFQYLDEQASCFNHRSVTDAERL